MEIERKYLVKTLPEHLEDFPSRLIEQVVPKAVYDKHLLKDGDKLEVVNFVGGG